MAEQHDKKKWVFGLLGVVSYYACKLLAGVILGLLDVVFDLDIDYDNSLLISVIALPFGLLTCYLVYYFLKKRWEK